MGLNPILPSYMIKKPLKDIQLQKTENETENHLYWTEFSQPE